MVKVRDDHPLCPEGRIDLAAWSEKFRHRFGLTPEQQSQLTIAIEFADAVEQRAIAENNVWGGGEVSTLEFGLEMVEVLAELHCDVETLVAAAIYRCVREEKVDLNEVKHLFGDAVADLIDGVLRMAVIGALRNDSTGAFGQAEADQIESVRKMLVAMIDDVRVGLIKIVERTCAIRTVKFNDPEKQIRVAREVRDVYAPLAHRLGIGHLKWELEDLAFRYLEAKTYKEIAKQLDEKRVARQEYIAMMIGRLNNVLGEAGIHGVVEGRAKHIFSIWKKMLKKEIAFSQVYDIRAVRILVDSTRDCYSVLGLVHALWRNIPHEFDDYIASPKENGYRSLHTAVVGPEGKVIEVQIRTNEMHEEAEFGVCAHWRYKGADMEKSANAYEQKMDWLRNVLSWHEEEGSRAAFAEQIRVGIIQDRVYVFTPEGHVVDLPLGATALDFAYQVHTEVGHRCRGAKVNGRVVPLNQNLRNGDQVEIITGRREAPSRSWLDDSLGYIVTSRAKTNISHWFRQQARDQNVADGGMLLDREFKRLGLMSIDFQALYERLGFESLDDLYAAVGASDLGVMDVISAALELENGPGSHGLLPVQSKHQQESGPAINGLGNLAMEFGSCCSPSSDTDITGFVDNRRVVIVHSSDCPTALQFMQDEPERIIKLSWGGQQEDRYVAQLKIEAWDRTGLLRDVTTVLDLESVNVTAISTKSDRDSSTVDMSIECEVDSIHSLAQLISVLNQLPNVISAQRIDSKKSANA